MAQHDPTPGTGLPVVSATVCTYLRSKGMYITGKLDPAVEDGQVGDGNCWCNSTQTVLGPDDAFVSRKECVPGRTCFVARL